MIILTNNIIINQSMSFFYEHAQKIKCRMQLNKSYCIHTCRLFWAYLKHLAEMLPNIRQLLEASYSDNLGPYRRALEASVRHRTYSMGHKVVTIKSPLKNLPFLTKEDGTLFPGVLEYFTDAIVPFLYNFFILYDPSTAVPVQSNTNHTEIAFNLTSAIVVSPLCTYYTTVAFCNVF